LDDTDLKSRVEDLTRRLAESEAALKAAVERLRGNEEAIPRNERLEGLGARAEALAHDLNNVFAPILMAAALLKEKVTDEKGLRMVTILETNAERGAALVRQVQVFLADDGPPPAARATAGAVVASEVQARTRQPAPPPPEE
jgi:signal transduction histidine kinase